MDLVMYVSRGSPELRLDEVTQYPVTNDWSTLFSRCVQHPGDDGHLVKLVRALAHGQEVCRIVDKESQMPVSGDMWLRIGNMGKFPSGFVFSRHLILRMFTVSNSLFPLQLLTPLLRDSIRGQCGSGQLGLMRRGRIWMEDLVFER